MESVKPSSFKTKTKSVIAHFSSRERAAFCISVAFVAIGAFGSLAALSNRFAMVVPIFGGTYSEGVIGAPRFINPILASSDSDHDLDQLVYSGLVKESIDGNLVPDLAQSWTISPDGKTYTVLLKPNLKFHDGKPITATDIVFTVNKLQDATLKSPLRVAWDGVSVSEVDPSTVVFTLSKPYAGFLNQLTLGIMPSHIWSQVPDTSWQADVHNTEPIGSGPFRVTNVSRSRVGVPQTISLKAFRNYVSGSVKIANLTIKAFSNMSDAEDAYHAGSIDGLSGIDSGDITSTKTRHTQVLTSPLPRVFGLFMNPTHNKAFADQAVIKAINLAVDKNAIIQSVFNGYAHALSGPLPQMTDSSNDDLSTKITLAQKTLDAAGWKIDPKSGLRSKTVGKSVIQLTFSISTANTPELEETANLISTQLQTIGIQTNVKVFEIGTLNQNVIRSRDFDALLFGEIVRHDTDIYAFWHSSQRTDPGLNITGYVNKTVDANLEKAFVEPDAIKRMTIYQSISQTLAATAPVAFLYSPDFIYLTDGAAHNVTLAPITDSSDRFSTIDTWYMRTDRVWNFLLGKQNR